MLRAKSLITIIAVIFNYLGLPRSGKTSLRRRITGEIENIMKARQKGETEQPSTGVLEDGGQVLIKPSCLELGTIRSKIWSVIKNLGDEANMLNQFFHQIATESPTIADKPADKIDSASLNTSYRIVYHRPTFFERLFRRKKKSARAEAKVPSKDDEHEKVSDNKDALLATAGDDADEMFSIIREAMATDKFDEIKYLLEDTILLINNDTGGHAEFLDLQAALVQGPSFNLLFSRLGR